MSELYVRHHGIALKIVKSMGLSVHQINISETVAIRTVKLAHRPRIASTTIKFISKPILLFIL